MRRYMVVIGVLIVGVIVWFRWAGTTVYRVRDDPTHSWECLYNVAAITDALVEYVRTHEGKLPKPANGNADPYAWVPLLRPVLERQGIPPNSVLCCPANLARTKPSSYRMNPAVYGKSLSALNASQIVLLEENANRHEETHVLYSNSVDLHNE